MGLRKPHPGVNYEADLTGTVSMVTGASGGMGRITAAALARQGSKVVLVVRNHSAGWQLREFIMGQVPSGDVEVLAGDLSSQRELHRIAGEFIAEHERLDLLINNAGAHFRTRRFNDAGIEMHIAVDYLAAFTLSYLLLPRLRAAAPARVVNVVSRVVNDTRQIPIRRRPRPPRIDREHLEDLRLLNGSSGFTPFDAYGRAKLLTVMAGYYLAEEIAKEKFSVNSLHPGLANTDILDDIAHPFVRPLQPLTRRLFPPAEVGAQAIIRLATAREFRDTTGSYFNRTVATRTPSHSYDRDLQRKLWETSVNYVENPLLWTSSPPSTAVRGTGS